MSYDLKLNDTEYSGVDTVRIPSQSGGYATFTPAGELRDYLNGKKTELHLDDLISVADYACYGKKELTTVILENLTACGELAFYGCTNLTSADLPNAQTMMREVFKNCTSLTELNATNLTTVADNVFNGCSAMEEFVFPRLTAVGMNMFSNCTSLKKADLGICTSVGTNAFYNCTALEAIILRSTTVATLSSTLGAGTISTTFSIYVPATLVDSYKAATGWVQYADRIVPIEGSAYE